MQGLGIFVPRTLSYNLQKFNRCLKPAEANRNWAVVVAQRVAWSLPIPEDPGSYLVTGNFYWTIIHC